MNQDKALENLRANINILANPDDDVERIAARCGQETQIQLIEIQAGFYNLAIESAGGEIVSYHAYPGMFEELVNQVDTQKEKRDVAVIIGTGFGYQFMKTQELLSSYNKVFVLEPEFPALYVFLTQVQFTQLFAENASLIFAPDPAQAIDIIVPELRRYRQNEIDVFLLDSIRRLHPDYVEKLNSGLSEYWEKHTLYLTSQHDQNREILNNCIENLPALEAAPLLKEGSARSKRAIVTGSGTSLNNHIRLLPSLAEDAILIAGGSSAVALQKAGISPDLVVITDPQSINARHFSDDFKDSTLIADIAIDPTIFKRFAPGSCLINIGHVLPSLLFSPDVLTRIKNWGTVTTTAISVAHILGFSEIALLGMELSFTGNRIHAKSHSLYQFASNREIIKQENALGSLTNTTRLFKAYAEYTNDLLESLIKQGTKIYNCCDGGLITEAELLSLQHLKQIWKKSTGKPTKQSLFSERTSFKNTIGTAICKLNDYKVLIPDLLSQVSSGKLPVNQLVRYHIFYAFEGLLWPVYKELEQAVEEKENSQLKSLSRKIEARLLEQIERMSAKLGSLV